MTPKQFAEMRKTRHAPCGCTVTFGRDVSGAEQHSCLHGDDCAEKASKKDKKSA